MCHTRDRPPLSRSTDLAAQLAGLQRDERSRAQRQAELEAYRLELRHFDEHLEPAELPDLERLPLLRRSADRILDYLAESELEQEGGRPGPVARIKRYFRYGSLRGLDPDDTDVVLRLERAYYEKRIGELGEQLRRLDDRLRRADFASLSAEHRRLSTVALRASLNARYRASARASYPKTVFRQVGEFVRFAKDYPVVLSTCHALADCIPDGHLLDYIVIDEASQVDLLAAGLALARCRNLVVVGDSQQLPQISRDAAAGLEPPGPAYDYREHSILLRRYLELYPDVPRTLLREHYRCDPAIIGFCNKAFYGGALTPVHDRRSRAVDGAGADGGGQPHASTPRWGSVQPAGSRRHRQRGHPARTARTCPPTDLRHHHATTGARSTRSPTR